MGLLPPALLRKRRYTLRRFVADSRALFGRRAQIRAIWNAGRLDPGLREQVMVAVAQVNACGFCTYVHREAALHAGADIADVAALEGLNVSSVSEEHLVAVMWAQDRAQAGLGPAGTHLEHALAQHFSAQQRHDLDTVVRVMTRANLLGNTFEALVYRFRGQSVPGSRLIDEALLGPIYLAGAIPQALLTARMRGKSPMTVVREAAAMIRAAA